MNEDERVRDLQRRLASGPDLETAREFRELAESIGVRQRPDPVWCVFLGRRLLARTGPFHFVSFRADGVVLASGGRTLARPVLGGSWVSPVAFSGRGVAEEYDTLLVTGSPSVHGPDDSAARAERLAGAVAVGKLGYLGQLERILARAGSAGPPLWVRRAAERSAGADGPYAYVKGRQDEDWLKLVVDRGDPSDADDSRLEPGEAVLADAENDSWAVKNGLWAGGSSGELSVSAEPP